SHQKRLGRYVVSAIPPMPNSHHAPARYHSHHIDHLSRNLKSLDDHLPIELFYGPLFRVTFSYRFLGIARTNIFKFSEFSTYLKSPECSKANECAKASPKPEPSI